jgi:hypothetical protein
VPVLLWRWLFSSPLPLLAAAIFGLFFSGSVLLLVGAALTSVTAVKAARAGNGERCGLVMAQA